MAPPALDAYQIGWICALSIEVAAAKQMLDENFGIMDEQDSTDTNSYTLGRVGRHYVVIAGRPGGQYGTTSTTTVAMHMMRTFSRSLRIGLMVGIGGGIPSVNQDIRLGDIVVSYPDGTCGGVLQYDMGKVVGEGKLQRTGSLNSPPRYLLAAVANMRASVLTDDPSYPEYIEKATQRSARTGQSFGRPDVSTDRLFKIEHDHPTTASLCEACLPEWEENREARQELNPQVFYGIIASGNAVIKRGVTREWLRRETGALCVEMEAAGLMMNFPCIVVRGICDYADSHKNKQWQGYAALAAASYAKELLSYVPVGLVSQEKFVSEILSGTVDELKEFNNGMPQSIYDAASDRGAATVSDSAYYSASSRAKPVHDKVGPATTLEPTKKDDGTTDVTRDIREVPEITQIDLMQEYDEDRHDDGYSDAGSLAEYEIDATDSFAGWALATIRQQFGELNPSDMLAILPEVLQEFAIKLGHEGKSPGHRKLMYIAHKPAAYRAIAKLLDTIIEDSDVMPNQSSSDDDEEDKRVDDVHWGIRMDLWDNQAAGELPPEAEIFHMTSIDPLETYREILHNAEISSWLALTLKRSLDMRGVDPSSVRHVRREVLDSLEADAMRRRPDYASAERISPRRDPPTYETCFKVQWDPLLFLKEEYPGVDQPDLTSVITSTGNGAILQALPCKEYMMQVWHFAAPDILSLMAALVADSGVSHEVLLKGNSLLKAYSKNGILEINIRGTKFQIAEVAEMFAWLGSALQPRREAAFSYIAPELTWSLPDLEKGIPGYFDLHFIRSPLEIAENSDCWKRFFTYMTVARGFPIPSRPIKSMGLEIPLDIAASIIGAVAVTSFKSRLLIKGFSALLYPARVDKEDGTISWHLVENSDGSRISYADPRVGNGFNDDVKKLRNYDIETARHIVGWCTNIEDVTGTAQADYNIGDSGREAPPRGWVLEKLQISGGKYITPTGIFSRGKRIRPLNISREGRDIVGRLEWLDNKNVVLFDTLHRRGWMVDGPSALLHLARASLKSENGRYVSQKYADITLQEPMFHDGDGRHHSHRAISLSILTNDNNLDLELRDKRRIRSQKEETGNKYIFEDRVSEILAILEQIFDHQMDKSEEGIGFYISSSPWKHLQGFDFVDVANRSDPFGAKGYELEDDGRGWVEFTRAVNAITLFGSDYGELLRPILGESGVKTCSRCLWNSPMPKGRDILAVSMAQLEYLHRGRPKWGGAESGERHVKQNLVWSRPGSSFEPCICEPRQFIQARVQTFTQPSNWPLRIKRQPETNVGIISRTGAVLLGIHCNVLQKPMPSPTIISLDSPLSPSASQEYAGSNWDSASITHTPKSSYSTAMRKSSSLTSMTGSWSATSQKTSSSTYTRQPPPSPFGTAACHSSTTEDGQGDGGSRSEAIPANFKRRANNTLIPDSTSFSHLKPAHAAQSRPNHGHVAHMSPSSAEMNSDQILACVLSSNRTLLRRKDRNRNLAGEFELHE